MFINDLLVRRGITKYGLSKLSGVPQATINDICSGKTDLAKCSAGTLYRISKALNFSMEDLLEAEKDEYRSAFETFKSNTCHRVKDMGDIDFMMSILEKDEIRLLFDKHWYPESLYLLAMLDYLSRINDIPICTKYDDIRKTKLSRPIYPIGAVITDEVMGSDDALNKVRAESIPEFTRFNIYESEIRNVI